MSANLTPVFQACPPRPPELTGSSYAADLHRAIRSEVATPQGALDFFRGTIPGLLHRYLATDSPLIAPGYHARSHSGGLLYQLRRTLIRHGCLASCGPTATLSQRLETALCR